MLCYELGLNSTVSISNSCLYNYNEIINKIDVNNESYELNDKKNCCGNKKKVTNG